MLLIDYLNGILLNLNNFFFVHIIFNIALFKPLIYLIWNVHLIQRPLYVSAISTRERERCLWLKKNEDFDISKYKTILESKIYMNLVFLELIFYSLDLGQ